MMRTPMWMVAVTLLACSEAPATSRAGSSPGADGRLVAAKPDVSPAPGSYVRLKRVEVIDRHGFEKPMRAASLLIPSDWTMQDQVQWATQPGAVSIVQVTFRAASADGRYGLELFPVYSWGWSDDPMMQQTMQMAAQNGGAPAMPPMPAGEFLTKLAVPNLRPGSTVLGLDKVPGVDEALQQQVKMQVQAAQQVGYPMSLRAEHARARLRHGSAEEWLTAAVYTTTNDFGLGMGKSYVSVAQYIFAFKAPVGELAEKDKLFQMILSTVAVDWQWQARVNQVSQNIQRTNAKGAADRAKIIADANAEVSRTITEGYEARQRSQDRNHENFTDYIRDVQRYQDPSTGEQMKLTSGYDHVWSSGNGEYVFTDSAGFRPGQVFDGTWTELKTVKNP